MDRHYYQLLLSEALYKNDSTQLNRPELLAAMAYYDSICCNDVPRRVSTDAFLAARCHYMNGVGYYEMDSVIQACEEYMKALEIMEEQFDEKELVGYKAKFMALTYTHLCGLFSDQYLHEQVIYFGKQALLYYYKYDAEPWHIAWILEIIGSQYHMMEQTDEAACYYDQALRILPDTNCLLYRDLLALRSLLSYYTTNATHSTQNQLQRLLSQAESKKEFLARCLNISEVYYHEKLYDSAWVYLIQVFNESDNIDSKKQAAEWLVNISNSQGKSCELYAGFFKTCRS